MGKYALLFIVIATNLGALFFYFIPTYREYLELQDIEPEKMDFAEFSALKIDEAPAFVCLENATFLDTLAGYHHEPTRGKMRDFHTTIIPVVGNNWTKESQINTWLVMQDYVASVDKPIIVNNKEELMTLRFQWIINNHLVKSAYIDANQKHHLVSVPIENSLLLTLSAGERGIGLDGWKIWGMTVLFIDFLFLILLIRLFRITTQSNTSN